MRSSHTVAASILPLLCAVLAASCLQSPAATTEMETDAHDGTTCSDERVGEVCRDEVCPDARAVRLAFAVDQTWTSLKTLGRDDGPAVVTEEDIAAFKEALRWEMMAAGEEFGPLGSVAGEACKAACWSSWAMVCARIGVLCAGASVITIGTATIPCATAIVVCAGAGSALASICNGQCPP